MILKFNKKWYVKKGAIYKAFSNYLIAFIYSKIGGFEK